MMALSATVIARPLLAGTLHFGGTPGTSAGAVYGAAAADVAAMRLAHAATAINDNATTSRFKMLLTPSVTRVRAGVVTRAKLVWG